MVFKVPSASVVLCMFFFLSLFRLLGFILFTSFCLLPALLISDSLAFCVFYLPDLLALLFKFAH